MVERFSPDELAAVAAEGAIEDDAFAVKLGLIWVEVSMQLQQDISLLRPGLDTPFLPDILEQDGIFQFPNRIHRRDLIRELRARQQ